MPLGSPITGFLGRDFQLVMSKPVNDIKKRKRKDQCLVNTETNNLNKDPANRTISIGKESRH